VIEPRIVLGSTLAAAIEALVDARVEAVLTELRAERANDRWLTGAAAAAAYLGCVMCPDADAERRVASRTRRERTA
jgi:hypothetical protein